MKSKERAGMPDKVVAIFDRTDGRSSFTGIDLPSSKIIMKTGRGRQVISDDSDLVTDAEVEYDNLRAVTFVSQPVKEPLWVDDRETREDLEHKRRSKRFNLLEKD